MSSTTSSVIASTAVACFNLLYSLSSHQQQQGDAKISLPALLTILQQRETPFYSFMTIQCGVNLNSLCQQFIPADFQNNNNNNVTSLQIGEKELEIIFRILVSSASSSSTNNNNSASAEQICDLLHVTVSTAVADAALELIRETKKIIHATATSSMMATSGAAPAFTSSSKNISNNNNNNNNNNNLNVDPSPNRSLFSSDNNNNTANVSSTSSTAFDVDFDFVHKINRHIQTFGSAATCQKIIKILEKENQALGKESVTLWSYALDMRQGLGGMDEPTRQDLIGAALEVTGRELYPAVASTHVAAELVFRKIVDCIH